MKTVHVFLGVDMRMGHDGLESFAQSKKINLRKLEDETACVFISRDRMRIKSYAFNGVLSYIKARTNRPFDLDSIDEFPRAFDKNGTMNYAKALKARLQKVMKNRGLLPEGELLDCGE